MPSGALWMQLCGIGVGAVLGAWARWGLSLWLNSAQARLPLGTLTANVLGGALVGAVLAFSEQRSLPDSWRLFLVTGFLGALTTFSTFSAESLQLALRKDFVGMLLHSAVHLLLSVGATALVYHLLKYR
jgi:fluoride exporter